MNTSFVLLHVHRPVGVMEAYLLVADNAVGLMLGVLPGYIHVRIQILSSSLRSDLEALSRVCLEAGTRLLTSHENWLID
jgi:hypothetical protein